MDFPDIPEATLTFFKKHSDALLDYQQTNALLKKVSGINHFFASQKEVAALAEIIKEPNPVVSASDRREYGDFQTNSDLARRVVQYAFSKQSDFEFVLEPTCGKGSFILAVLEQAKALQKIVGVELYLPYVWETKFKILAYFLSHPIPVKPEIDIIHANAFDFPYEKLANSTRYLKTLVIGNPPWVTNAELGSIDSQNLPPKSNFKKHSGFDALTGKGNFDIGESIALKMLKYFQKHEGIFAFLIKNSIVKNLISDQKQNEFSFSKSEKLKIDSKKEFNVSVNACLFLAHLHQEPDFCCRELDFYSRDYLSTFGWHRDKFVASIQDYDEARDVDGKSKFVWRSGLKHDCSKVMELEKSNGHFTNGLGEEFNLEDDLVYGLLKSADLKVEQTHTFRKLTIITQTKIGQETRYIKDQYPLTYQYLYAHKAFFEKRKSSIYRGKPAFSIFGIGDYSFAPYKVAISGLYKSTHFTLVRPDGSKPIMLDDTCYFIGFEQLEMAQIAHFLVNSDLVQKFLEAIIFSDAKRSVNKDTLMRLDFGKAMEITGFGQAQAAIPNLLPEHWTRFADLVREP